MTLEDELVREIEKWAERLDNAISKSGAIEKRGEKMLSNIRAYREDSKHFLERGDLIKSFECLIWAWALLETGKELGHLEVNFF